MDERVGMDVGNLIAQRVHSHVDNRIDRGTALDNRVRGGAKGRTPDTVDAYVPQD